MIDGSPDPVVLQTLADLVRDPPHTDADEAWGRLAHLTAHQRAVGERVFRDLNAAIREHTS